MENNIKEGHRTLNRVNQKQTSPRHMIVKLSSVEHKDKNLKCAGEKNQVMYRGTSMKLKDNLSEETHTLPQ